MNTPGPHIHSGSLDRETMTRLRSLAQDTDPALFSEILCTYRDDLAKYLGAMRKAVAGADATALRHGAHAMKGASKNTGALRLGDLCHRLETAADQGHLIVAPALLAEIEAEIQRVQGDIALELSLAA